ncbi:flavin reductase family protein [Sagittula sp. NFXS13]|uniref:flavin reductase family protein n=1 Tax=Sagittula sp. NFXS13 TaxID=2819095 RepID=UPI0032DFDF49
MTPIDFKQGMRRLTAGVSLITVDTGTARHGLIATAVTSLCAEPPSLLVCVNQTASIHAHLSDAESFCVNVLSQDQQAIAQRFATPKNRESRFDVGEWMTLDTGAPALVGSQVSFDCKRVGRTSFGTHSVFIGEIVSLTDWQTDCDPLIWHDGQFTALPQMETA